MIFINSFSGPLDSYSSVSNTQSEIISTSILKQLTFIDVLDNPIFSSGIKNSIIREQNIKFKNLLNRNEVNPETDDEDEELEPIETLSIRKFRTEVLPYKLNDLKIFQRFSKDRDRTIKFTEHYHNRKNFQPRSSKRSEGYKNQNRNEFQRHLEGPLENIAMSISPKSKKPNKKFKVHTMANGRRLFLRPSTIVIELKPKLAIYANTFRKILVILLHTVSFLVLWRANLYYWGIMNTTPGSNFDTIYTIAEIFYDPLRRILPTFKGRVISPYFFMLWFNDLVTRKLTKMILIIDTEGWEHRGRPWYFDLVRDLNLISEPPLNNMDTSCFEAVFDCGHVPWTDTILGWFS